uniref:hypothetical protein n=1 Tax=Cephaleuros parasiticus TaxID=173370 RepID=UPI001EDDCE49|nr:hypothetical protein MFQ79_pgp007 [Cephaleuros parasiticus]UIB39055.1 hypothetical protein [Cephaleuros parasiticus]
MGLNGHHSLLFFFFFFDPFFFSHFFFLRKKTYLARGRDEKKTYFARGRDEKKTSERKTGEKLRSGKLAPKTEETEKAKEISEISFRWTPSFSPSKKKMDTKFASLIICVFPSEKTHFFGFDYFFLR